MIPKIIDIISFNGEPIIELRIKYLYEYVDKFFVIEAKETHSGKIKDEIYSTNEYFKNIFQKYADKINIVIIDKFPDMPNDWIDTNNDCYMNTKSYDSWFREHFQRNCIVNYLDNYKPYIALVCDSDEIPNIEILNILRNNYEYVNEPCFLKMKFYYYNFNWIKKESWYSAYIINDKGIDKYKDLTKCRLKIPKNIILDNGGWHCSYFLSYNDISRKLESFAHREFDIENIKNKDYYLLCINSGKDIFNRGEHENLIYNTLKESELPGNKLAIDFNNYIINLQN
jgi:beta-1,4-mannosyl-glycoprotein beta-1,4-N-acetylglucosaminyltransferase